MNVISRARARAALPLAALALPLAACATQPPTRTAFLGDPAALERAPDTVRAQIDRRRDVAVASRVTGVLVKPTKLAPDVERPTGVDDRDVAVLLREMDRQLCYALSRRFEIVGRDAPGVAVVRAQVTRIQSTNAAASVASAVVSRAIPGPGSVRLPVGRGGVAVEAKATKARHGADAGGEAAAMAWSRGAGVALDRGSLSPVGDAHRYAADFADDFADWLAGDGAAERAIGSPDPCASFGPRLDPAQQAARFGLGLHTLGRDAGRAGADDVAPPAPPAAPSGEAAAPQSDGLPQPPPPPPSFRSAPRLER